MVAGLAAALLIFSGFWQMTEWLMGGRNRHTLWLIVTGVIYIALGVWLIATIGGVVAGGVSTLIVLAGGSLRLLWYRSLHIRHWVLVGIIGLDVIVLLALVGAFLGV